MGRKGRKGRRVEEEVRENKGGEWGKKEGGERGL